MINALVWILCAQKVWCVLSIYQCHFNNNIIVFSPKIYKENACWISRMQSWYAWSDDIVNQKNVMLNKSMHTEHKLIWNNLTQLPYKIPSTCTMQSISTSVFYIFPFMINFLTLYFKDTWQPADFIPEAKCTMQYTRHSYGQCTVLWRCNYIW